MNQIFDFRYKLGNVLLAGLMLIGPGKVSAGSSKNADSKLGQPAQPEMESKKSHSVEVGDKLRIKIYPEDEYIKGGEMDVSSEGTITLPLIGKVKVQGRKIEESEAEIASRLSRDYLVNPVVVIEVAERIVEKEKKTLAILGQVQKPGSYEIPPDHKLTLLQVVSMAGGFTEIANVRKIKIIRKENSGKTHVIQANAQEIISGKDPDIDMEPEDVIHVAESFF